MKKSSFIMLFFSLIAITFQYSAMGQTLPSSGNEEIMSIHNKYLKAVNLDEGKILSKNNLNKFLQLALNDNWYSQINFWVSAQWGVKEYEGLVAKQYELNGKNLTSPVTDRRPKKVEEGNIYGIRYDGSNDFCENADVKAEQPLSILLVFKADKNNGENVLMDTKGNRNCQISIDNSKDGESQLLIRSAGEVRVKGLRDGVNIVYVEFDLKNSKVFINGDLVYNNPIGKSEINGIKLGEGKINDSFKYFKGVMYETGIINNLINDQARTDLFGMMKDIYQIK